MSLVTIPNRFRVRRRTAASWTSLNEVLLDSEIGLESDTTWPGGGRKFKVGDGTTAWNSLAYAVPDVGGGGGGGCCEILVADGMSAPPVMLTNEAEDDFLYSD